jgi:hypothetical protein
MKNFFWWLLLGAVVWWIWSAPVKAQDEPNQSSQVTLVNVSGLAGAITAPIRCLIVAAICDVFKMFLALFRPLAEGLVEQVPDASGAAGAAGLDLTILYEAAWIADYFVPLHEFFLVITILIAWKCLVAALHVILQIIPGT